MSSNDFVSAVQVHATCHTLGHTWTAHAKSLEDMGSGACAHIYPTPATLCHDLDLKGPNLECV